MVWWLWVGMAFAQEPTPEDADPPAEDAAEPPAEEPDAGTIGLPSADLAPLPSALDLVDGEGEEVETVGVDPGAPSRPVWLARTAIRPRLQVLLAQPPAGPVHPLTLGLEASRRTWLSGPRPTWGAEVHFDGDLPLGALTGSWDAALGLRGQRFLGPVGLQVGPEVIGSRYDLGAASLPAALGVGARVALVAGVGPVEAYVGVQPVWWLAGRRDAAGTLPVDGLGDEQRAEAGLAVQLGERLQLRGRAARAWTATVPLTRVGLGVSLTLF